MAASAADLTLNNDVFINCPFDSKFLNVFRAIVFAVKACGFEPRSARDSSDSGRIRIDKIRDLIRDCDRGIHDLSAVTLDSETQMPRFNMPLELGLSLGAVYFGDLRQRAKKLLVLDEKRHQYDASTSDISSQDIMAHAGRPDLAIGCVREFLDSGRNAALPALPGAGALVADYRKVRRSIEVTIVQHRLDSWKKMSHRDYLRCVDAGLRLLSDTS